MLRQIKAQSTAEYVIVLGLIVAAVVGMQTYIKRGFQGRIKDAVNYVDYGGSTGDTVTFSTKQYEPYYAESKFTTARTSEESSELKESGAVGRKIVGQDVTEREGEQKMTAPIEE